MLSDSVLDHGEQQELLALLSDITGDGESLQYEVSSLATKLPLSEPPPIVEFSSREFCLTGRFVFGTRKECENEVITRGGLTKKSPTKSTNYLVIGHLGSQDWIHSTHGRKVERAVQLADSGSGIYLVSEQHWVESILAA